MTQDQGNNLAEDREAKKNNLQAWNWGWSFDPSKVSIYDQAKVRARKNTLSNVKDLEFHEGRLEKARAFQKTLRYSTVFFAFCSLGLALATVWFLIV